VGTDGTQCAVAYSDGWIVAHRMRVRLTVRYRTFGRTARQALFLVQSRIRSSSTTVNWCSLTCKHFGIVFGIYDSRASFTFVARDFGTLTGRNRSVQLRRYQ
jgi:hypothetical protein